jgi:hypothetical protein
MADRRGIGINPLGRETIPCAPGKYPSNLTRPGRVLLKRINIHIIAVDIGNNEAVTLAALAEVAGHHDLVSFGVDGFVTGKAGDQVFGGCGGTLCDTCHEVVNEIEGGDVEGPGVELAGVEEDVVFDCDIFGVLCSEAEVLAAMEG